MSTVSIRIDPMITPSSEPYGTERSAAVEGSGGVVGSFGIDPLSCEGVAAGSVSQEERAIAALAVHIRTPTAIGEPSRCQTLVRGRAGRIARNCSKSGFPDTYRIAPRSLISAFEEARERESNEFLLHPKLADSIHLREPPPGRPPRRPWAPAWNPPGSSRSGRNGATRLCLGAQAAS